MTKDVRTGLDMLTESNFALLRGVRVGLLSHDAAVDRHLWPAAVRLHAAGIHLAALFAPEHGLQGIAQDLESVADQLDPQTGLPVISLYGRTLQSLTPTVEMLSGLDVLVIDLVDIGSRYYTFHASMLYCLAAAAKLGLRVMILDRPNPLGGIAVEGPTVAPGMDSFVGAWPLATRHGLTMGEMAQFYRAQSGWTNTLQVIRCEGWQRSMRFAATGLPWVLPSPNMPTLDTALVYPGMCLIEGTNLSEGRGTTRPFELVGLPGLDSRKAAGWLEAQGLPGVVFRPVWFRPMFQKHAGQTCGGVRLHVTDPDAFLPVRTGLAVVAGLRAVAGAAFAWRTEPYEFVADRPAIDLLFGSDRERLALEAGRPWREIAAAWETEEAAFRRERSAYLLYS